MFLCGTAWNKGGFESKLGYGRYVRTIGYIHDTCIVFTGELNGNNVTKHLVYKKLNFLRKKASRNERTLHSEIIHDFVETGKTFVLSRMHQVYTFNHQSSVFENF